jgi:glycosyltransferase involved in cell wall biosynthesis
MPEVLCDGGASFDPEQPESIARAAAIIIRDAELRSAIARGAQELAAEY